MFRKLSLLFRHLNRRFGACTASVLRQNICSVSSSDLIVSLSENYIGGDGGGGGGGGGLVSECLSYKCGVE
jgi:hypothetical protein